MAKLESVKVLDMKYGEILRVEARVDRQWTQLTVTNAVD